MKIDIVLLIVVKADDDGTCEKPEGLRLPDITDELCTHDKLGKPLLGALSIM